MFFEHDGVQLHAKLSLPENDAEKHPLVIIVHGFTGHMEEHHIRAVADTVTSIGFAALRVELYGHGKSGGAFRDHDILKWANELTAVIDKVRQLEFLTDLYLCGHSQGGLAVMLAAAQRQNMVAGLIPLSPAWTIPDNARRGNVLGMRFDPTQIPEEISRGENAVLSGNYLRAAQAVDAKAAIRSYSGPVLIVHGTADTTVPFACSEEAAALYRCCKLVPVQDSHCFDRHPKQMTAAIRNWLIQHAKREASLP